MGNSISRELHGIVKGTETTFKLTVPIDNDVYELKKLIHKEGDRRVFRHVNAMDLRVEVVKDPIPLDPTSTLSQRIQSLGVDASVTLNPTDLVLRIFPQQPPRGNLHLIVTCPPPVPTTPPPKPPLSQISPPSNRSDEQATQIIAEALDSFRPLIEKCILGGGNLPEWHSTGIPFLWGRPNLLFHNLGKPRDRSDKTRVRIADLFCNGPNILFINTSGSGKTRSLFEGLCEHWGFYFVCSKDKMGPGSKDLSRIVDKLPTRNGFSETPPEKNKVMHDQNCSIAHRYFRNVVLARMILFQFVLDLGGGPDAPDLKHTWLLMQALPDHTLEIDVFHQLTEILRSLPETFLCQKFRSVWGQLRKQLSLKVTLNIVLDEAQVAATTLPNAFLSSHGTEYRPVLRELISALAHKMGLFETRLIISGTGINSKLIETSVISTHHWARTYSGTGAFDSPEAQSKYIVQYLWPDKSRVDPEFVRNAWRWLQGRYRFTATLVEEVLMRPEVDRNALLAQYIYCMCGYRPFTAAEGAIDLSTIPYGIITPPIRDRITSDNVLGAMLLRTMMDFVLSAEIQYTHEEEERLVEIGIANIGPNNKARITEPIAALSLVSFFVERGYTIPDYLKQLYVSARGTSFGNVFEEMLAWQFHEVFGTPQPLNAFFDFKDQPEWMTYTAQLVAADITTSPTHFTPISQSSIHYPIAIRAKDENDVLQWVSNPNDIPVLFPDNHCGPDLILVLELVELKKPIVVFVQSKATEQETLKNPTSALASINPQLLYMLGRVKGRLREWKKGLPQRVQDCFKNIGCELVPDNVLLVLATREGKVSWEDIHLDQSDYNYALLKPAFIERSQSFATFFRFLSQKFESEAVYVPSGKKRKLNRSRSM